MAVYNGMPHLKDAVNSILSQTYRNFEFVIVDDASTDDGIKYLNSLKDKRIRLIRNNKNLGLATSLNIALNKVQGEYIARMDADDISLFDRFKTQLEFLTKHKNIDICGTWVDQIDASGETVGEKKFPTYDSEIKKRLAWTPSIVHPTLMAKAKFFKEIKYDPRFDYAEEYELLIRAKNKFKMANIPKKLLQWRVWDQRRSKLSWEKMEKVDYEIKKEAYKRGEFTTSYFVVVATKYIIAYILPYNLKLLVLKLFRAI